MAAGVTVLVLLAARTMLRNPDWSDERSLYQTGLHVLPNNAKLHHNLARVLDDPKDAEHHFRMAIRYYKYYGSAYINLGVVLANDNRLEAAVRIWKDGLAAWSARPILGQDPVILNLNIGTGLKNLGQLKASLPYIKRCLELSPGKPNCQNALNEVQARIANGES
eukprot:m.62161 g.62161  ORF g.62161 m.62161 type:complete len:165 (-) comp13921_c0_seq1:103-597(-)